jgi:hypothetical protein
MDDRHRWRMGLLVGALVGIGSLVGGVIGGSLGLAAAVLLAWGPPRTAPVGGFGFGFGMAWLLLLLRADLTCDIDCVGPEMTGWYALGAVPLLVGAFLSARLVRTDR